MTGKDSRFERALSDYTRISIALVPLGLLLQLFEVVRVRSMHPLPPGSASPIAQGFAATLIFAAGCVAVFAIPAIALLRWRPRAGRIVYRLVISVIAIASALLSAYFATALIPLGDDLFGYSISESIEAAKSSGGFGLLPIGLLVGAGVVAWLLTAWTLRLRTSVRFDRITVGGAFLIAAGVPILLPDAETFASDEHYFLALSKPLFFVESTVSYFTDRSSTDFKFAGYPLLHVSTREDVLGPFLNRAPSPPNIVVLIVEGLGSDFVGNGAQYGGFTPYLDSLTTRSLYWENFLSDQGRTFGVFPSLLASLPPARGGFMSLGANTPMHESLVSLLGKDGYETNFFTGTHAHFDMIDTFLDRQGIGRIVDQAAFPPSYKEGFTNSGGFTWGYPDDALFRRSLEVIGPATQNPRLDIYLTISSHEPFQAPGIEQLRTRFDQRLSGMRIDDRKREVYKSYRDVFSTFIYVDDAIRGFFDAYSRRADFARTIFVITGDHRIIPVPEESRISRYHVPLVIYSPLLKQARIFPAVSSHLDVTPSLVELLRNQYGLTLPDTVAWIGTGLDTSTKFRSAKSIPLMRTKSEVRDFMSGDGMLARGSAYEVDPGLVLRREKDKSRREVLKARADSILAMYAYTVRQRKILPPSAKAIAEAAQLAADEAAFQKLNLGKLTTEQLFAEAQRAGFARQFERSRVIARHVLAYDPRYHDMRALLGRTYGWERRFDDARPILESLARRAPFYREGRLAIIDLEIWSGHGAAALARTDSALRDFPGDTAFIHARPRALELLGATQK